MRVRLLQKRAVSPSNQFRLDFKNTDVVHAAIPATHSAAQLRVQRVNQGAGFPIDLPMQPFKSFEQFCAFFLRESVHAEFSSPSGLILCFC
jgi:hypothetical protein